MKRKYSVELSNLGQFVDCYMALGLIADFFHLAIEESDIAQAIVDVGKWIRQTVTVWLPVTATLTGSPVCVL